MKIESLYIEGFGHFSEQTFGPFDAPLTVMLGYNEAGKSTLLAFIRTVLFGFPAQKWTEFYPSLRGGRHGGRLTLRTDDGVSYTVERIDGGKGGSLRITNSNGLQSTDENLLQSLLGNSSRKVFEAVFALGIGDLQNLKGLNESDASAQIYAAGMGATNLPKAIKDFAAAQDGLFKKGGTNQEVAILIKKLDENQQSLNSVRDDASVYANLTNRRGELEREIAEATATQTAAAKAVKNAERLQQAWDDWMTVGEAGETLRLLPERADFPENALPRLEAAELALREAERLRQEGAKEFARAEEEAAAPIAGEHLVVQRALVEELRRQRGAFDASIADLPKRRAELASLESDLQRALGELGTDWTEARVESFDTSIPLRDTVEQWRLRLGDAEVVARDTGLARGRAEQQTADAATAMDRARVALEALPVPVQDAKACEAARATLRECRERLADYQRIADRRTNAEATTRQFVPVSAAALPARKPALAAGVLLAAGAVSLGWGALLGGNALVLGVALGLLLGLAGGVLFVTGRWLPTAGSTESMVPAIDPYLENLRTEEQATLEALHTAARPFGEGTPTLASIEHWTLLVGATEQALRDLALATKQFREAEEFHQQFTARLEAATRDLDEADGTLKARRDEWNRWLTDRHLAGDLLPSTVTTLIERVQTVRAQIRSVNDLRHRITAIERDIAGYHVLVEPLAVAHGIAMPQSDDVSIAAAADRLDRDFGEALKAETLLEEARRALEKEREALANLASREVLAQKELLHLLEAGKAGDGEQFRRNARDHEERTLELKRKSEAESRLRRIAGGGEQYEAFLQTLSATEFSMLELEHQRSSEEMTEADDQHGKLNQEYGQVSLKIEQLANDEDASRLRAEREMLVEQLSDTARRWATFAVAQKLLEKAQRKYEEEHQPDVLRSAEAFFSTVTGGRYERLISPLGSQEITAIAPDGSSKTPAKLSRGTEDQLYLALRFGLIREFGQRATHLPVIVDDILVNFDPERAQRAANAFAELAKTNQVLVFTCQPTTVEMFRKASAAVRVIELGGAGTQG